MELTMEKLVSDLIQLDGSLFAVAQAEHKEDGYWFNQSLLTGNKIFDKLLLDIFNAIEFLLIMPNGKPNAVNRQILNRFGFQVCDGYIKTKTFKIAY